MSDTTLFYGKYRGCVLDRKDPQGRGRLKLQVNLGGEQLHETGWAEPCLPYAGEAVGWFLVPPDRAHVWVEFVAGDVNQPLWTGCYWPENGKPPADLGEGEAYNPDLFVLQTSSVHLSVDEPNKKGSLKLGGDVTVTWSGAGVEVTFGKGAPKASVKLETGTTSINGTGLVVK